MGDAVSRNFRWTATGNPDAGRCGARGRGLQPRTRAAGYYEPPARSSLTTGLAGESAARRRDKNATSGAPRGEHSSQLVCADCVNLSAVARDASRLTSVARRAYRKVRHKVRLPALRSPHFHMGSTKTATGAEKIKTSGRRSVG